MNINPNRENENKSIANDKISSTSFHKSDSMISHDKEIEKLKLQIELAKLSSIKPKPSEHHLVSDSNLIEDNLLIKDSKGKQEGIKKKGWFFHKKTPIIPFEKENIDSEIILNETSFKTSNIKRCPICKKKTFRSKVFYENYFMCQIVKCKNKYCVYAEKISWKAN